MKTITLFLSLLIIVTSSFAQSAADESPIESPKDYQIGAIVVNGASFTDPQAIIAVTGFKIGDNIRLPGSAISTALKAIWKMRLFEDVQILKEQVMGNIIHLNIVVEESPRLNGFVLKGIKKRHKDDLVEILKPILPKGSRISAQQKAQATQSIIDYYNEKGHADLSVELIKMPGKEFGNTLLLEFEIKTGKRQKISDLTFDGNIQVNDRKLRKLMEHTKRKRAIFSSSKFLKEAYKEDKKVILAYYQSLGYLDANIKEERIWRGKDGDYNIHLSIEEGSPYYFGDINWLGNSKYDTETLNKILGIKKGEIFNPEAIQNRLHFSPDGSDVSSLYMDNGHLFFRAEAIEKSLTGDTIDLDIHLLEGPQATIGKVTISGNDQTSEEVIRRELRTEPGKKFSRSDIIRSQRQIVNLGYFNPEGLEIKTEPNPENGTVDIEYVVEEKPSQQIEASAGWGGKGTGLVGTLGISLNNFSMRKFLKPNEWDPLPQGDGQALSFRIQSNGKRFQSYNLSFTEPWLGGKKPNQLSVGGFYNRYTNGLSNENVDFGSFERMGGTVSFGSRLEWPDDNFVATTAINFQRYALSNWTDGLFQTENGETVSDGNYNNLSITQTIARSTINHPFFPSQGSKVSLAVQFTPPFSLFKKTDPSDNIQDRYRWLEYHKWRFDAETYLPISEKLVVKVGAKMGFLGRYNKSLGTSPFERFQLGGDALDATGSYTGIDNITLRGYDPGDLENNIQNGQLVATPIFNKFTAELRYLLSANQGMPMYLHAFAEAGNAWQSFGDYNPFDLKRSVGVGFRMQMPMFGTLGVDYGIGFDKLGSKKLSALGQFSFTLGFEID